MYFTCQCRKKLVRPQLAYFACFLGYTIIISYFRLEGCIQSLKDSILWGIQPSFCEACMIFFIILRIIWYFHPKLPRKKTCDDMSTCFQPITFLVRIKRTHNCCTNFLLSKFYDLDAKYLLEKCLTNTFTQENIFGCTAVGIRSIINEIKD